MTEHAALKINPAFTIGEIDPRLYGGFVEHMGRCVYTGIYEPGHASADADGFRGDVMDLVRGLSMPVMRYPGGNFVSQYNWEEGIGPREQRPVRLDLAWRASEPNEVGIHEYMDWCHKAGTDPILAVNLGTRGAAEARDFIEYCNHPGGTTLSDARCANGSEAPFAVRTWCLGNEMDGPWQSCAKTPTEYGRLARETAKLMRWVDDGIELIVCGSSNDRMRTFGEWEWEVLGHTYNQVDYLSIHCYYDRGKTEADFAAYLASPERMSAYISRCAALCDAVGANKQSDKKLMLAFDEWNVTRSDWFGTAADLWGVGRRMAEQKYDLADGVVFGGLLTTLLNHADRVKIGCLAQTVNVLAPIMTEPGGAAWAQTIYHPFALTARFGRGRSLQVSGSSPLMSAGTAGDIPMLLSAVTHDEENDALACFLVNRDPSRQLDVSIEVGGDFNRITDSYSLQGDDPSLANTPENPTAVSPQKLRDIELAGGNLRAVLPPMSWNLIRLGN